MRVVLASQSPRRLLLLSAAGLVVQTQPGAIHEAPEPGEQPQDTVLRLAREKAGAVVGSPVPVVAADTEVVLDGAVLGKPADPADATRMLSAMAGRGHDVLTGWCVRHGGRELAAVVRTRVWFRPLTAAEIAAYIATGEPFDKAGGYGIQGVGGTLVDRIEGSFTNVVGLPLAEVLHAIRVLTNTENRLNQGR